MPVFYTAEPSIQLTYYLGIGGCTGSQFLQAARQLGQTPLHSFLQRVIIDQLDVTELEYDPAFLGQAVAAVREAHALSSLPHKIALLSLSRSAPHLVEIFSFMAEGYAPDLRIFNQLLPALAWLGLTAELSHVTQMRAELLAHARQSQTRAAIGHLETGLFPRLSGSPDDLQFKGQQALRRIHAQTAGDALARVSLQALAAGLAWEHETTLQVALHLEGAGLLRFRNADELSLTHAGLRLMADQGQET
jgi:hypothetical protein